MALFGKDKKDKKDPRPPVADSKTAPFGKDKKDKKKPVDEKGRKSTVPLSVVKEKPGRKKCKNDLDDAFSSEVMQCFNNTNASKQKLELIHATEVQRHNKVMEDIAMKEQEMKQRQDDIDFKMKRLEHYASLKGKFAPEFIGAVFPELKDLVDADTLLSGMGDK